MEDIPKKNSKLLKYLGLGAVLGLFGLGISTSVPKLKSNTLSKNKTEYSFYQSEYNSDLEKKVESFLEKKVNKNELSSDEKTAWLVYDFSTNQKLVSINEDVPLQGASMIKPFIALAFYHLSEQGKLKYGPKSKQQMEAMIQHSNNQSANWVMQQVGGPKQVQKILTENYGDIFKQTQIKEYIPKGGRTYKNQSSAHDYSRFLYALWNNKLPNSDELKRLMALPGKDRLYTGVENIPEGTKVYNKTGTNAYLVGDMGILSIETQDGERRDYSLVGIIEREDRSKTANQTRRWWQSRGDVIRDFSGLVYEDMKNYSQD